MKKYKSIIWDWNGTLLNDTQLCIDCMNQLLTERNLTALSKDKYREIFTFPVKDYYLKAGFDFSSEDFEIPAMQFIDLYYQKLYKASLFRSAPHLLNTLKGKGYIQSILSAMEHESLLKSLKAKSVLGYFDHISGIKDHYAFSKLEMGIELLQKIGVSKHETIFIGDTLHDLEVGTKLGIKVVLIANGHQSKERLLKATPNVFDDLADLMALF